ncbi:MAG: acyltransferase family protein [Bacteroidales bacterium]|nr:acyltransferase family protein [Bacteroidales bacterium]
MNPKLQTPINESKTNHSTTFDLIRIVACLMIILVHAAAPYFFDFKNSTHHFWGNIYGSFVRAGVPMFIVLSGMLLLPVQISYKDFLKRRMGRILFPFAIWAVIYFLYQGIDFNTGIATIVKKTARLLFTFPDSGEHLWYLYMLVGLYLFMPIISPWLKIASKKEEQFFIAIWVVSLFIPFISKVIPNLWGVASWWNEFGALHYFSGFIGFLVIGHYLNKYQMKSNIYIILAALLFIFGYVITSFGQHYMYNKTGQFGPNIWNNISLNVAIMTVAAVVLLQNITIKTIWLKKLMKELADKSFGIFLIHYLIVFKLDGYLFTTSLHPAVIIPLNTIVTLAISYLGVKIISFLPFKKYIIG